MKASLSNATISVANVEDSYHSTKLLAQTTLRNILGTKNLHEILSQRETIANSMQVRFEMLKMIVSFATNEDNRAVTSNQSHADDLTPEIMSGDRCSQASI